ncbi:cation diffusion facilitator family transporter [Paenibacillus physcomitrellae]|uniref:Cation diffusion facilitator family transporter n=1 Tax=Paenibacillus physcomitrellae TaxID=1619311 RepID=A0ABQ1GE74_9BACL|nr:cation transporter [Paenibacillus physcomitrellae]GGA41944.1 hypothetical protein GCM10010917_29030 [Paenibacillus physcomitrellae]
MRNRQTVQMDEVSWAGALNRLTLALFKGAVGWLGGSKVLLSDALFSAGDAIYALTGLLPGKLSGESVDKTGRTSRKQAGNGLLMIAVLSLILVWGAAQAIAVSVKTLMDSILPAPHYAAGMAAIVSIGINEALFQNQLRRVGWGEKRKKLLAEHRLSILSSLIVLIGVICAMTGDLLDNDVLLEFDPAAAIIVGVLVLWKVGRMLYETVLNASAAPEPKYDTQQMMDTIQRVYGVITVDELQIAERGGKLAVYVQISVNPHISMHEAVEIAGRTKVLLLRRFAYIQEAEVHVMPYNPGYPYKSNYEIKNQDETLLQ